LKTALHGASFPALVVYLYKRASRSVFEFGDKKSPWFETRGKRDDLDN
jgi:hypothetical protein